MGTGGGDNAAAGSGTSGRAHGRGVVATFDAALGGRDFAAAGSQAGDEAHGRGGIVTFKQDVNFPRRQLVHIFPAFTQAQPLHEPDLLHL